MIFRSEALYEIQRAYFLNRAFSIPAIVHKASTIAEKSCPPKPASDPLPGTFNSLPF